MPRGNTHHLHRAAQCWMANEEFDPDSISSPITSAPLEISHCEGKIDNQIINEHFTRMMQGHLITLQLTEYHLCVL